MSFPLRIEIDICPNDQKTTKKDVEFFRNEITKLIVAKKMSVNNIRFVNW